MKVLQVKPFCNKKTTLKVNLVFIVLLFCLFKTNAQEQSNITLRVEPGFLLLSESESLGLLLNIEPNIKISYNKVIGLRFGIALNSQKFNIKANTPYFIDTEADHATMSFVPTYDYYLNESYYRPYLGLGVGYYVLSDIDVFRNNSGDIFEISVKNQLGLLLRGGLELGRTKIGLEYNFIPQVDMELPNNEIVGTVDNSYFGVIVGFTIGGGKN